jgi:hypothetical protein
MKISSQDKGEPYTNVVVWFAPDSHNFSPELPLDLNLVQVQKWSFALEETPDFELDLV